MVGFEDAAGRASRLTRRSHGATVDEEEKGQRRQQTVRAVVVVRFKEEQPFSIMILICCSLVDVVVVLVGTSEMYVAYFGTRGRTGQRFLSCRRC